MTKAMPPSESPCTRRRNVVLLGFMGTGKTTVGRALARRLKAKFVDMDAVLESRAGKPISRIFAEDGEPAFRAMERALVRELSRSRGLVIAAGGGVVLNPLNVRDFRRSGLVVCLSASPEIIYKRTHRQRHRPLLESGDKLRRIVRLLALRRPFYDAIPHQIDTSTLSPTAVVRRILALYQNADAGKCR